jgi:hypothetical protein
VSRKAWKVVFVLFFVWSLAGGIFLFQLFRTGPFEDVLRGRPIRLSEYVLAGDLFEGLALVQKKETFQFGFIDAEGRTVIPCKLGYAESFSEGLAVVGEFQRDLRRYRYGYVDKTGELRIPLRFDDARPFSGGLAAVKLDGKYGYIDQTGQIVIEPRFDEAHPFSEDRAKVIRRGRTGFIDASGNWVVPAEYYRAGSFSEGRAFLCNESQCGFIGRDGRFMIALVFDDARSFKEGLAPVKTGKKWRYINEKAQPLGNEEFDQAFPFSEGLGLVGVLKVGASGGGFPGWSWWGERVAYGFIQREGRFAIEPKYAKAEPFSNGLCLAMVPGFSFTADVWAHVFIDRKERPVSPRFDIARSFTNGFAAYMSKGVSGFIDIKGERVMEFNESLGHTSRPRHLRYGVIDRTGTFVVRPEYQHLGSFSEGLAPGYTATRGTMRYLDRSGRVVFDLPSRTVRFHPFSEGLAAVQVRADSGRLLYGFVDPSGKFVIPPRFHDAKPFAGGLAPVKFGDGFGADWGYVNPEGRTVIEPQFKEAEPFFGGLALVTILKQREHGMGELHPTYIDRAGKVAFRPTELGFSTLFPPGSLPRHESPRFLGQADRWRERGLYSFVEPLVPMRSFKAGGRVGYVDKNGHFAIPPSYEDAKSFSSGMAPVKTKGCWGFIDANGDWLVEPSYDGAEPFSDGLARIEKNGKYGYVDRAGRWVVPPRLFEEAYSYSAGFALVRMNSQYGFIDTSGKFAIEPVFKEAQSFSEGLAVVGQE